MTATVAVVGSINHDLVVRVPRHPVPGETILGRGHFTAAGGKGANQAVAAARLGSRVAMVGRIGADAEGEALRAALAAEGIDVAAIGIDGGAGTGLEVITVDDSGENAIVVSPGANARLSADDVAAAPAVAEAGVVLAQLEIPLEAVAAAARAASGTFVLDPAPARPLPPQILDAVDVLVPNRTELALLATGTVELPDDVTHGDLAAMARDVLPGRLVVVTLGGEGALVVADGSHTLVAAPTVEVVDTTAAGDAFRAALAVELAAGRDPIDATGFAVIAGALAATRHGAQPSLPRRREVEGFTPLPR